ncbi:MAG: glycosyltransferase family 4 protein [Bacteroidales bacterium]|jgi:glycosyltransferase involved in cell wall biosynthesis|nr:glycosyltransferase family 4 protein [Bacteroidales bacterium]
MKICHIIFAFNTGGTETMLVDIMNEQVKTETVTLIIVNNLINENIIVKINSNVHIIRINRKPSSKNPIPLLKINHYLFQSKPDIIHFHNVNGIGLILPCFRKKAVLTIHANRIRYPFFTRYKKLFTISQSVKKDILMRYGLEAKVVYNGVHNSAIIIKQRPERNNRFRIVQVGRLHHTEKGQDLLIMAMKQLVYDYGQTDIYLDFIGEGPSFSFLEQLVADSKLGSHIAFSGNKSRDYVYKHLCDYDLLVQPSVNEGFGLTVAEAMAAKVPVLVSNVEGPMEIIESGKYGYYFKSENVNDLAAKITDIIENYRTEKHHYMIENAYKHVLANFDIKNTALNYLVAYKAIK